MNMSKKSIVKGSLMVGFAAAVVGVIATSASGVIRVGPCVRGIVCPAIYDPVLCPDGNTYSNSCEAYRWACQRNCIRGV